MAKSITRKKGDIFEEKTACWMQKNGYRIVVRNWTASPFEIDIVAIKDKTLVFTEVKSGSSFSFETPETRIDEKKMRSLAAAAREFIWYLQSEGIDTARLKLRFDAAAVMFDKDGKITDFKYYENYFVCGDDYYEIL